MSFSMIQYKMALDRVCASDLGCGRRTERLSTMFKSSWKNRSIDGKKIITNSVRKQNPNSADTKS